MMMPLLFYVMITGGFCATLLCLCSLLAIWLALGQMHIFLRMPLFLLGTLPLGLVLCLASANRQVCFAYLFGALLVAISLPRTLLPLQFATLFIGAMVLCSLPYHIEVRSLDSSVIVRVTLAISFVACVLATLRWCGFRFIDLTEGIPGLELEQGTGRDLDQWIAYLDDAGAGELNHAEIMALLREFGFSFAWQKTVTVAYQKSLGRRSVGRASDGRTEIVVAGRNGELGNWLTRPVRQQFSIWQLMIVTFCVGSLLGFARSFSWSAPTAIDFKYGVPVTLGLATTTVVAVWACLAIHHARAKFKVAWLITTLVSIGVPLLMGFGSFGSPLVLVVMATMFGHGAVLIGLLSHLRYRGYRLVPVQLQEQTERQTVPAA